MLCFMKEAKFFEETCKDMIFVVGFILGFNLADTVPYRKGETLRNWIFDNNFEM